MEALLSLLKSNWFKPVVFCLLVFLIWQVTNHIPAQIKELNTKIDNNHKELSTKIDNNHNEIKNLFIEYLANKK